MLSFSSSLSTVMLEQYFISLRSFILKAVDVVVLIIVKTTVLVLVLDRLKASPRINEKVKITYLYLNTRLHPTADLSPGSSTTMQALLNC